MSASSDALAADLVRNQARLLRAHPVVAELGATSMTAPLTALHLLVRRVTGELPRRRKLAESMPDHVLGHEDRDEELPVVHVEGEPHELRRDHRAPRPGADHLLRAGLSAAPVDLALQARVDERALLQRARHLLLPPPLHDVLVGAVRLLCASCGPWWARPRAYTDGGRPKSALAAAHRMVDRVHRDAAHVRALAEPARAPRLADALVLVVPLPTWPIVAMHRRGPHAGLAARACAGSRTPRGPSAARRVPAARTSCAPLPGFISMRARPCRAGSFASGSALPGGNSARPGPTSPVAHRETGGRQDVALLAVAIVEQRDVRRAVRVVLDRGDLCAGPRPCRGGSRSCGSGACGRRPAARW